METKFTNLDTIVKTLENQIGQLALEMNEISSRPLSSDREDDDMGECGIVTLSFEWNFPAQQ